MKKIIKKIKYPKFLALILTFILAYILFSQIKSGPLQEMLTSTGYLGIFFAGVFYVYGFTAGIATAAILIIGRTQDIITAGLIAGAGALVGDLIIFRFIRTSFKDEIERLSKEKLIKKIGKLVPKNIRAVMTYIFATLFIALPLPDEIGVSLLATSTKITIKNFLVVSFVLNTAGILLFLVLSKL